MPHPVEELLSLAQPIIPTLKPTGELVPYVGETISQIKEGVDLVLNVAPEGCMVASMGEMLTPAILEAAGNKNARVQHLFNTEGELNEELLRLSLLKVLSPEGYFASGGSGGSGHPPKKHPEPQ